MNRDQLKAELSDILEQSVGQEFPNLSETATLINDLKLDSVDLLSMTIEIQSRYGIVIDATEVANVSTVGDVLTLITNKIDAAAAKKKAA
ncbi:MAG: acyl carrier protein [Pirellulales bacterium]